MNPLSSDATPFPQYPCRATQWKLRTRTLELPRRPLLMGIVNVTPDSFSDGGLFFDQRRAVQHARELAVAGADMLDVGGESTRPYSTPVAEDEEIARVVEVVRQVAGETALPVSIDTSKATVARACIHAGAEIINDVTALTGDPAMIPLAVESGAGVCAMHMQGTPQTMQDDPQYEDVVDEVFFYLQDRRDALIAAGIDRQRVCLDPGIGFGKTHQHNLDLLAACGQFHQLECPLLVGHSRKGFIAKVLGDKQTDRSAATIGVALALASRGIQIIRVHDVAAVRQALLLYEAVGGIDGRAARL